MIRMLQAKGVVAIACLPQEKSVLVGILVIGETLESKVGADLVDRDNPHAPETMVFMPNPCEPGVYYNQVLRLCPF